MICLRALLLAASFACASAAAAADFTVEVRDTSGLPVRDAVVAVHLVGAPTPAAKPGGSYAIDQQNMQFHPFVTVVPAGATVKFMNHDMLRHHVYSFSPAKTFELKLERQQQDRAVPFDKPGIVPLGCNIHDSMIAFVDVVDTPWAGKTDAQGRAVLHGLPPGGQVSVDVWHPWMRAIGNHVARAMSVSSVPARFDIALRAPPRPAAQSDY